MEEGVFSRLSKVHLGLVIVCFIGGCLGWILFTMVYGTDGDPVGHFTAIAVGSLAYPIIVPYLAYVSLSDWWTGNQSTLKLLLHRNVVDPAKPD